MPRVLSPSADELPAFVPFSPISAPLTPVGDLPRTRSPFGPCKIGPERAVAPRLPSVTSQLAAVNMPFAAVGEPRFGRGRRQHEQLGNRLEHAGRVQDD